MKTAIVLVAGAVSANANSILTDSTKDITFMKMWSWMNNKLTDLNVTTEVHADNTAAAAKEAVKTT
jgi:hypothetical protein